MKEIWKDIKKYEGIYQVSDLGRIKSLARFGCKKERILKPCKDSGGYLYIRLYNNEKIDYRIHRLVLETFVGPCPPGMECRHLDGNKENNVLENLCWGTHSENVCDTINHGTFFVHDNRGSKCGTSKLNEWQVRIIKKLLKDGYLTTKEIAKIFNVSVNTIYSIKNGYNWRHI